MWRKGNECRLWCGVFTMREDFRPVKGYGGNYLINSEGIIKSVERQVKGRVEGHTRVQRGRILKQQKSRYGYMECELYGFTLDTKKTKRVHRMVAEVFIPNPNNHPQVNHINGVKSDNSVENLEWCTASYNTKHAHDTGLASNYVGEKSVLSKLTEWEVHFIRYWFCKRYSVTSISKVFPCGSGNIYDIMRGKSWNHLVTDY